MMVQQHERKHSSSYCDGNKFTLYAAEFLVGLTRSESRPAQRDLMTTVALRVLYSGWYLRQKPVGGGVRQVVSPTLPFPLSLPSSFPFPVSFQSNQWEGRSDPVRGSSPASPYKYHPVYTCVFRMNNWKLCPGMRRMKQNRDQMDKHRQTDRQTEGESGASAATVISIANQTPYRSEEPWVVPATQS